MDVVALRGRVQVKLEAAVGQSGYGDIGVDSFRLENGSCPGK